MGTSSILSRTRHVRTSSHARLSPSSRTVVKPDEIDLHNSADLFSSRPEMIYAEKYGTEDFSRSAL
ncbi:hypothetical protein EXIGLDRAFT_772207 [Exidia glandulosa HHB12029]|uniref:Uncharacterized protein n=1 Tax=Exidia glandulosa HHB12029 TaxID=1314781 RepID=A0A165FH55_EXIGL|nr:hypothetical protein EXIGLDRAFT_772207 [Exidia glandulosa HHB12029]